MLSFQPPSSRIHPSFWTLYHKKKLEELKLDDTPLKLDCELAADGALVFGESSFSAGSSTSRNGGGVAGTLLNYNTIEAFKRVDKAALLTDIGKNKVWQTILSGEAIDCPEELLQFIMISFADLKAYKFTFWMGFAALVPSVPYSFSVSASTSASASGFGCLEAKVALELHGCLARLVGEEGEEGSAGALLSCPFFAFQRTRGQGQGQGQWKCVSLRAVWSARYDTTNVMIVCATDAGTDTGASSSSSLAWSTRNLLALFHYYGNVPCTDTDANTDTGTKIRLVCIRSLLGKLMLRRRAAGTEAAGAARKCLDFLAAQAQAQAQAQTHKKGGENRDGKEEEEKAVTVDTTRLLEGMEGCVVFDFAVPPSPTLSPHSTPCPTVIGWESNSKGRPGPRCADLSCTLDPTVLMKQAVDLNLRLMKWRRWPDLHLDAVRRTRCLLLGAGTLGCAVARVLLGWGVSEMTLVDSGKVSYSNPARQCLFTYADAVQHKYKALAAAEALVAICPHLREQGQGKGVRGVVMSLPMPGHPLSAAPHPASVPSESIIPEHAGISTLASLVQSHDVVFSLLDSREGRWLPSVMCAAYGKVMITAALGFDTYLIMHHGSATNRGNSDVTGAITGAATGADTGCYFCSDVIGATNTMRDRTLDQQCTVTRPGLAFIAAGIAVELMVSIVQQQQREGEGNVAIDSSDGVGVPHQIRGGVDTFTQLLPRTPAFSACVACSREVVRSYLEQEQEQEQGLGESFVSRVCNDLTGRVLEDVSGITALTRDLDIADCCGESESDSDSDSENDGDGDVGNRVGKGSEA